MKVLSAKKTVFILFTVFVVGCGRPLSQKAVPESVDEGEPVPLSETIPAGMDWTQARIETTLIKPKVGGEAWKRKIKLQGSSDLSQWIVEKQFFESDQKEIWRSVGVTQSNGEFLDEHIDEAAIYRVGGNIQTQQFSGVKDLVVSESDFCKGFEGLNRKLKSYRVIFRTPERDETSLKKVFKIRNCSLDVEAFYFELHNSIVRDAIETIEVPPSGDDQSFRSDEFDVRVIAQMLSAKNGASINLDGLAGAKGLEVFDSRPFFVNQLKQNIFLKLENNKKVRASWNELEIVNSLLPGLSTSAKKQKRNVYVMDLNELTTPKLPEWVNLIRAEDGESGRDGFDGERGQSGGRFIAYTPMWNSLKVSVNGGEGGKGSPGTVGLPGSPGIAVYGEINASPLFRGFFGKDLIREVSGGGGIQRDSKYQFLGKTRDGKTGARGKPGRDGDKGQDGFSLWFPLENTSQITGFHAETISN